MEGVAGTKALLDRFNEVSMRFGEDLTADEMDELINEQAELQSQIDAADAWELDRQIAIAMDALRCPAGDAEVDPVLVRVLRLVVELKAVFQLVCRVAAHGVGLWLAGVGRHETPAARKVKLRAVKGLCKTHISKRHLFRVLDVLVVLVYFK